MKDLEGRKLCCILRVSNCLGMRRQCAPWSGEERDLSMGGTGARWSEVKVVWGPLEPVAGGLSRRHLLHQQCYQQSSPEQWPNLTFLNKVETYMYKGKDGGIVAESTGISILSHNPRLDWAADTQGGGKYTCPGYVSHGSRSCNLLLYSHRYMYWLGWFSKVSWRRAICL